MPTPIQLPDKASELKFPRYFHKPTTGLLAQIGGPNETAWLYDLTKKNPKRIKSYLTDLDYVERIQAGWWREITESEAKALLQNHGL